MTKDDAEMWARVARRIGIGPDARQAIEFPAGNWQVGVWDYDLDAVVLLFDPPASPADERMLWDYIETLADFNDIVMMMCDEHLLREAPRVTALGRAIDALPGDDNG